jgi:hypothetical protein
MSAARDDGRYLAKILKIAKRKFDAGDKTALLMAQHQCLLLRRPPPEWLRDALIDAIESAARFEIRSRDEPFGPPHNEKNVQLKPRKRHAELRYPVAFHVHRLSASGRKIDKGLFEDVARALKKDGIEGVGATTVEKIYYRRGGKQLHEMISPLLPGRVNPAKN